MTEFGSQLFPVEYTDAFWIWTYSLKKLYSLVSKIKEVQGKSCNSCAFRFIYNIIYTYTTVLISSISCMSAMSINNSLTSVLHSVCEFFDFMICPHDTGKYNFVLLLLIPRSTKTTFSTYSFTPQRYVCMLSTLRGANDNKYD